MRKYLKFSVLCAIFIFASFAHSMANEVVRFEGNFYRGSGQPAVETAIFQGKAGPATIRLFNGAEDNIKDAERVSSSVISVNGSVIFDSSNFNQNVSYLEAEITLNEGDNDLSVELRSKPGGNIRVLVVQEKDGSGIIWPEGGEIQGEDGLVLIVPSGATSEPIPVTITALHENDLGAPIPPNTTFIGGANIDMGENELMNHADLAMPAPAGVPDGTEDIYLVKIVEYAGQIMYQMVDTAIVENGIIVSQYPAFPGIIGSGSYVFLWAYNVGWIQGYVTNSGIKVPGAVVTLSGGYWLSITDTYGYYGLPAWAGNFIVNAFDGQTGEFGEKQGYLPYNGATVYVDVEIGKTSGPVHSTIINGDFETGDLTGWELNGAGGVISSLGPIMPYEGNYMGIITTGYGALGEASSVLEQSFLVPQGATKLTLNYNFVSEEYPHWVGSSYNDVMRITLHTPDGSREIAFEDVNNADFKPVYGIPDYVEGIYIGSGDGSWGETGWLTASIDVSQWAGTEDTLTITVHDVGDTIFDSIVLVDDIRFEVNNNVEQAIQNAQDNIGKTSGYVTWNGVTTYGVWADSQYTYCARFVRMCFGLVHSFQPADAKDIYNHYNNLGLIKTDYNPPPGAVVFYAPHETNWHYGHVGIVSWVGTLISVTSLSTGVNETNVLNHFSAQYLGYVTADDYLNNP